MVVSIEHVHRADFPETMGWDTACYRVSSSFMDSSSVSHEGRSGETDYRVSKGVWKQGDAPTRLSHDCAPSP